MRATRKPAVVKKMSGVPTFRIATRRCSARSVSRDVALRRLAFFAAALLLQMLSAALVTAGELSWISARGRELVDSQGHPVALRGVSLGGWLVEEMWMQPVTTAPPAGSTLPAVRDHVSLWGVVRARLGEAATCRCRTAFRNAWLDESDFDRIRSTGLNSVRLPFLYDLVEEPEGLAWLDRAIDWASRRGIYVVLDMHGLPGGQSKEHHTGQADQNRFFRDPRHIEHAERLWQTLARRYRDQPAVAAFELMNEPMGAPDIATLYLVQDRLYRAIRQIDSRHVVIFEDGYTGLDHMPLPAIAGWTNAMMSCHHYAFHASSAEEQINAARAHADYMQRSQERLGTPLYLGEFNQEPHGSPRTIAAFVGDLDAHGWSWAFWTYKNLATNGTRTMWAIYRNPQPIEPLDPYRDSEQQWTDKCRQMQTKNLEAYPGLLDALQKNSHTRS